MSVALDTLARWASEVLRLPEVAFAARDRIWLAAPLLLAVLLPLFLRRSRSALPALLIRALALAALVALLLEPQVLEREKVEGSLLVLADVSPSVGDGGRARERRLGLHAGCTEYGCPRHWGVLFYDSCRCLA